MVRRLAESAACVDSVRVLAMICLRNCIRSSWTPRKGIQRKGGRKRKFVIPEDEKKDVKRVLLSAIVAEPQAHLGKPILKQIIAAIQQIAGKDWPERWPTLLETLGQVCCATFAPAPLECLNKVLKTTAACHLPPQNAAFFAFRERFHSQLVHCCHSRMAALESGNRSSLLSLKCIMRMISKGPISAWAVTFFSQCIEFCAKSVTEGGNEHSMRASALIFESIASALKSYPDKMAPVMAGGYVQLCREIVMQSPARRHHAKG